MTAVLRHTPYAVSAVSATSAATGYDAANVLTTSIRKPWRSTDLTTQQFNIDLGAIRAAPVLCLQAPNAGTCTLSYGSAAYTTINAGTQTLARDRHGTRKHSFATVGSVRYLRLTFGATLPDDDAAMFELGAIYVFASTLTLPEDPLVGGEANPNLPQTRIELPNGNDVVLDRGAPRQRLSLRFRPLRTADMDELTRRARAGVCWLDLGVTANRELQWPVTHVEDSMQRTMSRALQDESQVLLREVA